MKLIYGAALMAAFAAFAPGDAYAHAGWTEPEGIIGHESKVLSLEPPAFYSEFYRLAGKSDGFRDYDSNWKKTLNRDEADLTAALGEAPSAIVIVRDYVRMRSALKIAADGDSYDVSFQGRIRQTPSRTPDLSAYQETLNKIPAEFALYARAAAAYRAKDFDAAIAEWNRLLALPADQRRWRTGWAQFMIGKATLFRDPAAAIPYFEKARETFRAQGKDDLHLGIESLGWQAWAERATGHPEAALRHYFQAAQAGEWETSSVSAQFACHDVLNSPNIDPSFIADPTMVKLLATYVNSSPASSIPGLWGEPGERNRLLALIDSAHVKLDSESADTLAWGDYSHGNLEGARKWLAATDARSPIGHWVLSKLLMHDGKIPEALDELKAAVAGMPVQADSQAEPEFSPAYFDAQADRGILLLGRRDFVSALDAFARSGSWSDTAYVAERVLNMEELSAYIRRHKNDAALKRHMEYWGNGRTVIEGLEYLLARRLARAHLFSQAKAHYPKEWIAQFDDYVAALNAAADKNRSRRERAEYMFKAAWIMRYRGMELFGTELDPDWLMVDGDYMAEPMISVRKTALKGFPGFAPALARTLQPRQEELDRVDEHEILFEKRWHYRFRASELMWEAAQLSPDNDPLTAAALYWGGDWHSVRPEDDAYADRFYQELVRRCWKLQVGIEADKIHWFPDEAPPTPKIALQ